MKLLRRILFALVVVNALFVAAAQVAKRMLPAYGDPESDVFALVAAMDGVEFASTADDLSAGSASAIMGGIELDLTGASLAPGARLELLAAMGGIDVVVPREWRVEVLASNFAGGSENMTQPDSVDDDAPLLVVEARTIMGGVAIRNPAEVADDVAASDEVPGGE